MARTSDRYQYDEDFFKDSRMTFGEHLDELRTRMWKALKVFGLCLIMGFFLDGIGDALGWEGFGIGRPVMNYIKRPIEDQTREFYARRDEAAKKKLQEAEEAGRHDKLTELSELTLLLPSKPLADSLGVAVPENAPEYIELKAKVSAPHVNLLASQGDRDMEKTHYLSTLNVMEAFMVYVKVSLLCGAIIACPWIFYQFWAFVGAGLYPHEKRYVHVYLPFSIGLFLAGIALCQFVVMPGAVKALLGFNSWLGVDPDMRLSEWLGFAIILPLVFGLSFQTPLVMLFLNKIGMFTWQAYLSKWRYAMMVLVIVAAVITPTPDALTMTYMFVPMFGLYMFGILICRMTQQEQTVEEDQYQEEVAV